MIGLSFVLRRMEHWVEVLEQNEAENNTVLQFLQLENIHGKA